MDEDDNGKLRLERVKIACQMGNQSDVFYYIYDRTNAPQYAIYYVYNVIKLNENDRMMIGAEMVSKLQVVNDNQ